MVCSSLDVKFTRKLTLKKGLPKKSKGVNLNFLMILAHFWGKKSLFRPKNEYFRIFGSHQVFQKNISTIHYMWSISKEIMPYIWVSLNISKTIIHYIWITCSISKKLFHHIWVTWSTSKIIHCIPIIWSSSKKKLSAYSG